MGIVEMRTEHFDIEGTGAQLERLNAYFGGTDALDTMVRWVCSLLDFPPVRMRVGLRLKDRPWDVRQIMNNLPSSPYHAKHAIAFFDCQNNIMYLAVDTLTTEVLAHEITHAVLDYWYRDTMSLKQQEMLAVWVAGQVKG